jgi:DNA-binding protein HU-beta
MPAMEQVHDYLAGGGRHRLDHLPFDYWVNPPLRQMSVVNKPATEAGNGVNPFTKEPMEFAAKPASKSVKATPLKVAKDAV